VIGSDRIASRSAVDRNGKPTSSLAAFTTARLV